MVVFPHFAADIPATIDNEAVHEAIETADRVIDEAKKAAEEASKNSAAALSLAKQIDLENKRIARLWFWQRPANWREFGGERARYQGYSSVGPDGRLFANGNGCWDFSDGVRKIGESRASRSNGYVVNFFTDGSKLSGMEYFGTKHRLMVLNSTEYKGVFSGQFGERSLILGTISYYDGVNYTGSAQATDYNSIAQPHGFGVITNRDGSTFKGEFTFGKIDGYGLMEWASGLRGYIHIDRDTIVSFRKL